MTSHPLETTDYGFALYPKFLSKQECERLIEMAEGRMRPSTVLSSRPLESEMHQARTSSGAFIQRAENPMVAHIEERIARITGLSPVCGEGMQVLKYEPGQRYDPHYDWFGPSEAQQSWVGKSGQRVFTVLLYLNDDFKEGETSFPLLDYAVKPKTGMALVFRNLLLDGQPDHYALHGGSPPSEGTKYVATKWVRGKPWPNGE